jgi:hypothetical protein
MYVVDVSDPASPLIVGKFNGGGYAADVAISGNYAIWPPSWIRPITYG